MNNKVNDDLFDDLGLIEELEATFDFEDEIEKPLSRDLEIIPYRDIGYIKEVLMECGLGKLNKYVIRKGKVISPRRLLLGALIVDVDTLTLCSNYLGDTVSWFDLKALLEDYKVDIDDFKKYLELHNLGLMSIEDIDRALFKIEESILKIILFKGQLKQDLMSLSDFSDVIQSSDTFIPTVHVDRPRNQLALRFYYLAKLRRFDYFVNLIVMSYRSEYVDVLIKELDLQSIAPTMCSRIKDLGVDLAYTLNYIFHQGDITGLKSTETYTIIEDILDLIGGSKC